MDAPRPDGTRPDGARSEAGMLPPPPPPAPGPPPPGFPSAPDLPPGFYDHYGRPIAEDRGRNGLAIAGLVLGIIPIFAGILGIIFGLVGRSQARARGQKGRVMGTWGAALGAVWLVLVVIGVAADLGDDAERDSAGQVVQPGEESSLSLQVGDCLRVLPADLDNVTDVDLIGCAQPHAAEVFALVALDDAAFPGEKPVVARADKQCTSYFETFVGKSYDDSTLDMYYIYPTRRSWAVGDRSITCLVSGKALVGTVKGTQR